MKNYQKQWVVSLLRFLFNLAFRHPREDKWCLSKKHIHYDNMQP